MKHQINIRGKIGYNFPLPFNWITRREEGMEEDLNFPPLHLIFLRHLDQIGFYGQCCCYAGRTRERAQERDPCRFYSMRIPTGRKRTRTTMAQVLQFSWHKFDKICVPPPASPFNQSNGAARPLTGSLGAERNLNLNMQRTAEVDWKRNSRKSGMQSFSLTVIKFKAATRTPCPIPLIKYFNWNY